MTALTAIARSLVASALLLALAAPVRAELVVLDDGHFLKVKTYELDGERVNLGLKSGGHLILPISRVERVVDDEVIEPDPPIAMGPPLPPARATIALRFEASQAIPQGPWGGLIWQAARRHGLNPRLVQAVIGAESDGNPRAISRVGARGLMQLMPATAERFGVRYYELFDPEQNLEAGTRYLAWLVEQFPGDLGKILAAYNAGEQAVIRYGGLPPYRETRAYVRRIFASLGLDAAAVGPQRPPAPVTTATASSRTADASR